MTPLLDAFYGCGTALVAAQNLGRQWIGIDISPTACRVMAKRLRDVCNMKESEPLWKAHRTEAFVVRDLPWTVEKLRAIPHFEFENWAVIALGGIPNKVQVGDMGIDGRIYPAGTARLSSPKSKPTEAASKGKRGETDHMFADDWFPIQVKQQDKVGRSTSSRQAAPTSTSSKPSWSAKTAARLSSPKSSAASSSPSPSPAMPSRNATVSTAERVHSSSC